VPGNLTNLLGTLTEPQTITVTWTDPDGLYDTVRISLSQTINRNVTGTTSTQFTGLYPGQQYIPEGQAFIGGKSGAIISGDPVAVGELYWVNCRNYQMVQTRVISRLFPVQTR